MAANDHPEITNEQIKNILISAVIKKIRLIKPDLVVTEKTRLKTDTEIDVFDFGDILVHFAYETDWVIRYEMLIDWFAKNDCNIEELTEQILYIKDKYKEKTKEV